METIIETSTNDYFSFDIVKCLPEDICDNIFGKLKSRHLLKASLVSTEWNKFIAKSAVCMKKLKLKFSPKRFKKERLVEFEGILMKSDRKYENVEFLYDLEVFDTRNILMSRERKWKKVTMTSLKFPTKLNFISFIAIVEPFVEELKMEKVSIVLNASVNPKKRKLSEQQTKSLTFPNLKFLELMYCDDSIIEVFQDVVTLTEFNLESSSYRVISTVSKAIQKIIRCNKELKKLTTICSAFDQNIAGKISGDITYKLISLEISANYIPTYDIKANFTQFLRLHMNTLETLSLDEWMGLEAVKVIFHMPKLKHLSLKGFRRVEEAVDWKEINFKKNLSLTSFDFIYVELDFEIIRALITATPNLKKLELDLIEDESIACISKLLPNLESLSVFNFKVLDVTDKSYFPNLKEFSMCRYAQHIKESEAKEDRSKFESLFLKEKKMSAVLETSALSSDDEFSDEFSDESSDE